LKLIGNRVQESLLELCKMTESTNIQDYKQNLKQDLFNEGKTILNGLNEEASKF